MAAASHADKLRRLAALSSLVTLAALSAVVYFLVRYTGQLVLLVLGGRPQSWWGQAGSHLLTVLTFIVLLAIGANTVPLLLLSPLQDPICLFALRPPMTGLNVDSILRRRDALGAAVALPVVDQTSGVGS